MLEKNPKISVVRRMIGLGDESEPHFIVPQNSVSNFRQRIGLSESSNSAIPPIIPLRTDSRQPATTKCPHCENMAKNFLYLESLIRSNYNPKFQCSLCYSSLKYLQYVNKSILEVFGNFDSIIQAAKAFANPTRRKVGKTGNDCTTNARKTNVKGQPHTVGEIVEMALSKPRQLKKKSKSKLPIKGSKHSNGNNKRTTSNFTLASGSKSSKSRSRNSLKKTNKKMKASGQNLRASEGALDNDSKVIKGKQKKGKDHSKVHMNNRSSNNKNIKSKHHKGNVKRGHN